jgi:hypothetical protein
MRLTRGAADGGALERAEALAWLASTARPLWPNTSERTGRARVCGTLLSKRFAGPAPAQCAPPVVRSHSVADARSPGFGRRGSTSVLVLPRSCFRSRSRAAFAQNVGRRSWSRTQAAICITLKFGELATSTRLFNDGWGKPGQMQASDEQSPRCHRSTAEARVSFDPP